jgi:hypothetical protein
MTALGGSFPEEDLPAFGGQYPGVPKTPANFDQVMSQELKFDIMKHVIIHPRLANDWIGSLAKLIVELESDVDFGLRSHQFWRNGTEQFQPSDPTFPF